MVSCPIGARRISVNGIVNSKSHMNLQINRRDPHVAAINFGLLQIPPAVLGCTNEIKFSGPATRESESQNSF